MGELGAALADADDEHALAHFVGGLTGGAHEGVKALEQWGDVGREDAAGVEVGEQVLHGEQGVDLLVGEPHAGQFDLCTDGLGGVDPVARQFAVPYDRGVHVVAQEGQITLERGGRDFERAEQGLAAHGSPFGKQAADAGEAVGLAHAQARRARAPSLSDAEKCA